MHARYLSCFRKQIRLNIDKVSQIQKSDLCSQYFTDVNILVFLLYKYEFIRDIFEKMTEYLPQLRLILIEPQSSKDKSFLFKKGWL
jgi:hypothetical protein